MTGNQVQPPRTETERLSNKLDLLQQTFETGLSRLSGEIAALNRLIRQQGSIQERVHSSLSKKRVS